MKKNLLQSAIFVLLLALGGFILPAMATAANDPLVSTEWLAKNLQAKDLVIIDVRTESNYGVGHIPGSVNMEYSGWQPQNEVKACQLMPPPEVFEKLMQDLGVNESSHVVIYDHGNSISDATKGGTALWVLKTMGHKHVSYLNGGFTKWTFEGREIDNVKPTPAAGNFTAKFDAGKVASFDDVKSKLNDKNMVFVDARSPEQHFGVEKRGDVKRFGHIPHSVCLPADYLTNAGANRAPAYIKSREQLEQIIKGAGLPMDKDREFIVYCNSCQFAGLGYLVLHEILGYKNVKVYDGSMLEYAAMEELPLVKFAWGHVTQ
ncbi:MAG: sulfurtransferase [Proteobacteria bacterium]|nr:sulfurtransferase [Pseudomonadota bacterium]MBU4296404.1 sulfurtransferase [Pseudomonadota bacterium]MCG2748674.1 sulfurtransferase [Desulfobulbaceae bacterium]